MARSVPPALRAWFVVHFLADMLFAVPLLFMPRPFLEVFGWTCVDPLTARLVGAALVGIGVESLLGRDATLPSFLTMLRLKMLWSATAVLGIGATMAEGFDGMAWPFLLIFIGFNALWTWWYFQVRAMLRRA